MALFLLRTYSPYVSLQMCSYVLAGMHVSREVDFMCRAGEVEMGYDEGQDKIWELLFPQGTLDRMTYGPCLSAGQLLPRQHVQSCATGGVS